MADEVSITKLGLFGLTRQEAVIYITLLSNKHITGYEISKQTGISKSNTYGALTSLVNKGAAYVVTEEAAKYTAVGIEEFCNNTLRMMEEAKKELIEDVAVIGQDVEGYITISGSKNIYNKLHNLMEGTKKRIYLSISRELLLRYQSNLKKLIDQGIKVVVITDSTIDLPGATIYYAKDFNNQIRIIVDSTEVLSGNIDKNCLYSKNDNLISIFKDMLTNEIELLKLKG